MAEFVRIWDDIANKYVEHDITVVGGTGSGTGGTGTTIPVVPISISSNVNTGVINKVIDTNEIITTINSVDIAQILRPVIIEKSSANRFTIQTSIANQISVIARRNNLIVNTSGVGRVGAQGEKGEDSIIKFNANLDYPKGTIVIFDGKIWISQSRLYGGITPLSNPAENEFWSQIADQKYVDFLPLTSGYEVASQEEWDAIENAVELGDIIRVADAAVDTIDIGTVNTDTEYTISDVGRALQDSSGRQYFVTGAFSGNEREIRATNREEITVADFEEALTLAGVVFGEDKLSGLNTAMNVGEEFANDSNNVFQITNVGTHTSTSVRVVFDPIAGSGPINVGFLSNTSPNVIGNKMYSGANPGVEISEAITNLVVGNRLHVVGEESSTTQNITKIEIVGGKTYFDIADYVGYDTGDKVIGRSISNETLVAGQWYVRNSNTVDKLRLDAIGPDVVLRADVSSLQNNFPTLTTNPGLVTANTRDRADNFFMNDGLDALGEYNQTAIPFTASHVSTLRFLLLKETGGRFDSNFSDPTDNEAQNLLINSGEAFPPTDQGSQQNFVDAVTENDQNLQITTTTQSVTDGLDIEIKTLSSNAEVNVVKSVNTTDTNNNQTGLKISTAGALSLDSTNMGGAGQGDKVIRLRSDGLIPPSVFGQVNLSATETFETTTDRNASTSRLLKMGDVAIITGDPAATDPFIGTFVFQSMDQTEALGSQNSDWIEIVTPTGAVASVAGKSGVVTLAIEDIDSLKSDLDGKATSITTNTTGIATNVTGIATNVTNIATNATGIATNVTNIATNTTGIATNVTNIATNTTGVATNVTNIATNATGVATNVTGIATNATGIATNTTGIATNVTNIATNATGIATNATGIATNATGIATNTTGIATNATGIATNTTGIATNATGIATNVTNIATNATGIATNTTGIATNATGIATNATGIATNVTNIATNVTNIATNATGIATNTTGVATNVTALALLNNSDDTIDGTIAKGLSAKQDTLTAGTGIGISAANVISVQNASGIQVTAFAFEKVDGDTLRITKFENGDTIIPADYEGAQFVIVDALDTELYNIAGTCSVTNSMGEIINNAQECQNTFSGTWTINSGPATLQRIS